MTYGRPPGMIHGRFPASSWGRVSALAKDSMEELPGALGVVSAIPAGRPQQRAAKDTARREEMEQDGAPKFHTDFPNARMCPVRFPEVSETMLNSRGLVSAGPHGPSNETQSKT
eukprot:2550012-Pyramimonas_sp.AAC.1